MANRKNNMVDRRKTAISDTIRDLFVRQLQHELQNFTLYSSFSVYYSTKGLEKLGDYYRGRAKEELRHQEWIMDYLSDCDADFEYPAVPSNPLPKITDDITPFALTVDREIETTDLIYEIADQAKEEGDWMTLSYLMGNYGAARLIPEQIEEESLSRTAFDIMSTDDHILKKEDQIYDLYYKEKK